MIKTIALRGILGLGLAALLSQAVIADDGFTQDEANTIVKEDIASAQVMAEVCPALIGKNAKFDANITALTQSYLADYSDKSMTLAKLQADSEYKSVLEEARQAAKETDKSEQKSVCDDVLNYEA
ncbi:MAG: MCR_0457 family protein [Acinetobacter gandensis]|uniref:MCR_0457 family protein n=1 Tax=Acinetobacter gandensis TaxID=1443941 RepID=UPI003D08272B